jgi:hypothetical protein
MEAVYRLSDQGLKRLRRRRNLQLVPLLIVVVAVVGYLFGWPPTTENLIALAVALPVIGLAISHGLYGARGGYSLWTGLEVRLAGQRIIRSGPKVVPREWLLHETRKAAWANTGDLQLWGPGNQLILIPPEIDGCSELVAQVGQNLQIEPASQVGASLEGLFLLSCGIIGPLAGLLQATDPRILVALGAAGGVAGARMVYLLLSDPSALSKWKLLVVPVTLPFVLGGLDIVVAIHTWIR